MQGRKLRLDNRKTTVEYLLNNRWVYNFGLLSDHFWEKNKYDDTNQTDIALPEVARAKRLSPRIDVSLLEDSIYLRHAVEAKFRKKPIYFKMGDDFLFTSHDDEETYKVYTQFRVTHLLSRKLLLIEQQYKDTIIKMVRPTFSKDYCKFFSEKYTTYDRKTHCEIRYADGQGTFTFYMKVSHLDKLECNESGCTFQVEPACVTERSGFFVRKAQYFCSRLANLIWAYDGEVKISDNMIRLISLKQKL